MSKTTETDIEAKHRSPARGRCFAFFLLLLFLVPGVVSGAPDEYLRSLQEKARELSLAEEREWEILLHVQPGWRGKASLIDDPAFFLAEEGKTDPAAELSATLRGFFEGAAAGDAHPRCRFPARFAWLQERLAIEPSRLPSPVCGELEQTLERVAPRSATLIFPGSHVNSPASMFGHTLINIEGPYRSELLSYAVNYAASTDTTNGFAYAFKGITGGYPGYFSLLPYYEKVREYNDMERRDIWEYALNLAPEEVHRLFLHVWELQDIYSDYYFFGENCSYNLLFLLEAARPDLRLAEKTRPWVIPVDTVRLVREAGLIEGADYRPSKATRLRHLVSRMGETEREKAEALLEGTLDPAELAATGLEVEERQRVLDLAIETVEFRYLRGELDKKGYTESFIPLLTERSRLGPPAKGDGIAEPARPDRGHRSNRVALAGGVRKEEAFLEVRLRPAYHHLLDADEGYLPGSQIEFADLALRYYPEGEQVELHRFDLIDIVSLSPRHPFFKPISWKVGTGFFQKTFPGGNDHLVYRLNPGGGFTWGGEGSLVYALLETDVQVGGRFRDDYALGLGGSLGWIETLTPDWKAHLWGRRIWFEWGDPHHSLEVHLDQSLRLSSDLGVTLGLSRHQVFDRWYTEGSLGLQWFW